MLSTNNNLFERFWKVKSRCRQLSFLSLFYYFIFFDSSMKDELIDGNKIHPDRYSTQSNVAKFDGTTWSPPSLWILRCPSPFSSSFSLFGSSLIGRYYLILGFLKEGENQVTSSHRREQKSFTTRRRKRNTITSIRRRKYSNIIQRRGKSSNTRKRRGET